MAFYLRSAFISPACADIFACICSAALAYMNSFATSAAAGATGLLLDLSAAVGAEALVAPAAS